MTLRKFFTGYDSDAEEETARYSPVRRRTPAVAFVVWWLAFLAIIFLGCSTPYTRDTWLSPAGWLGGYSEERIDDRTFLVSFQGNGYTSAITVQKYFLRRCAELTRDHGYRYFGLVQDDGQVGGMGIPMPGTFSATTTPYGSYGTVYPGATIPVQWYSRSGLIRFVAEDEAWGRRANLFDADQIWKVTDSTKPAKTSEPGP